MTTLTMLDLGPLLNVLGCDAAVAGSPEALALCLAQAGDDRWEHLAAARSEVAEGHAAVGEIPLPLAQLMGLGEQMWHALETAREGYRRAEIGGGEVADELRALHLNTIQFILTPATSHTVGKRSRRAAAADAADEAAVHADREHLGAACRRLRGERQLTQEQLAERAQVSPATINAMEKGQTRPHARTLAKIAAALGVNLQHLASG